jgi:hypothetical protein
MSASPVNPSVPISSEERRWLHDKFERLATEEASLGDSRTSYFAAIASALVAALVVLVINEISHPTVFVVMATMLAGFGILISAVWTVVLHRTGDAQYLWRQSSLLLEAAAPPIAGTLPASIITRHGDEIHVDLTRPWHVHEIRFSEANQIAWIDRVNPSAVSANVPLTLVFLWGIVLVGTWVWFFLQ